MIGIRRVAAATALAVVGVTGTAGMAYAGDYSGSDNSGDHHHGHHHDGDDSDHHHHHDRCDDHRDGYRDHQGFYHFDQDGLLGDLLGGGHYSGYDYHRNNDDRCSDYDRGSDYGGGFGGYGF